VWLLLSVCSFGCDGSDIVVFVANGGSAGAMTSAGAGGAGSGGIPTVAGTAGSAGLAVGGGSAGDGASGVGGDSSGYSCKSNADCPGSAWLCGKSSCSDAEGICEPRPFDCEANHAPVCGCDGITYWNDCLRKQRGEPTGSMGSCGANAKSCNSPADCGGGDCAKLLQNLDACGQPGRGVCHVTPPECLVVPESRWWTRCPPPGGGSGDPGPCLTTCQAVQTDQPYVAAPKGACP
jgi:hypothetical protein